MDLAPYCFQVMTCSISVAQQQASRSRESGRSVSVKLSLAMSETNRPSRTAIAKEQPFRQPVRGKGSWTPRLSRINVCHEGRGMQVFPLEHVLIGVLWLAVTLFVIAAVLGWIG
jgi:hypothetical protein